MLLSLTGKLDKLHAYLYIPYQVLQVVGYRLTGQTCRVEWGRSTVKPTKRVTRTQQLVGLLFPVVVFCFLLILELILATYILRFYYAKLPWLIIFLPIVAAIPLSPYFYQIVFDSWRAYRLLKH